MTILHHNGAYDGCVACEMDVKLNNKYVNLLTVETVHFIVIFGIVTEKSI